MIPLEEKIIVNLMKDKLDKKSIKYKDEVLGNFVISRITHITSNKFPNNKQNKTGINSQTLNDWVKIFINSGY